MRLFELGTRSWMVYGRLNPLWWLIGVSLTLPSEAKLQSGCILLYLPMVHLGFYWKPWRTGGFYVKSSSSPNLNV